VAANKVGAGKADLYLALDPLTSATAVNLDRCDAARTAAVGVSSLMPTGEMIRNSSLLVAIDPVRHSIARHTRPDATHFVDARRVVEGLFGDHMATNLFAVGVAYQVGLLPLQAESIEGAIRLNAVQVDANIQAFRYGRLYAHDPRRVEAMIPPLRRSSEEELARVVGSLTPSQRREYDALLARCGDLDAESQRLVAIRAAELIDYQDVRRARRYVEFVLGTAAREAAAMGRSGGVTQAVARYHYKLLAYKDEYEVARLHLRDSMSQAVTTSFSAPVRVGWQLHPPLLRALGLRRKLDLGPWFRPAFALVRASRRLRETPLDPFGLARVRQEERALIGWYEDVVARALGRLTPATHARVAEIAAVPDAIRGYEDIKLRNAAGARERAATLLDRLG
jgi:indolepyruvate ferredoxin oxidoreductase